MRLSYEDAKQYLKTQLEDYLQGECGVKNTHKAFKCVLHSDNHPSMSIDRKSPNGPYARCFACNESHDIFSLHIALQEKNQNRKIEYSQAFNELCELYDIQIEKKQKRSTNPTHQSQQEVTEKPKIKLEIEEQCLQAHNDLMESENKLWYLKARGLTNYTISTYKIGYTEHGHNEILLKHPSHQLKGDNATNYKYIFPFVDEKGEIEYFISELYPRTHEKGECKYQKIKDIPEPIFNERYLKGPNVPETIFICEGIYDALSIEEVGQKAISLNGVNNVEKFIKLVKKYKPQTSFVSVLDNDSSGQSATYTLKEKLMLNDYVCVVATPTFKDINEFFIKDKVKFMDFINRAAIECANAQLKREQTINDEYNAKSTLNFFDIYDAEVEKDKTEKSIQTGFNCLDDALGGGLDNGLYCIGAISSLGKTTLCLQILDNIAQNGHDVMIFSLEMARTELMAKSISRHTLIEDIKQNNSTRHAKTTLGVKNGRRFKDYCQEDLRIIECGKQAYKQYANHIYIHEGIGDFGITQIRECVEEHVRIKGKAPVVLVDYIQILTPYNERGTDKQNTDKAVLELKKISRDFSTPVIAISSFNRDSYTNPVSTSSFKESGAIEYSADILIGLQYKGMDFQLKKDKNELETEKERVTRVRKLTDEMIERAKTGKGVGVQIKILKNRNGTKGETFLDFYPMFNFFVEKGTFGSEVLISSDEEDKRPKARIIC